MITLQASGQFVSRMLFLFSPIILVGGCQKKSVNEVTISPAPTILPIKGEISYKSEEWKVIPYFGGPGEDSIYSSLSPELKFPSITTIPVITRVLIKSKSGSMYKAHSGASQPDSGYVYRLNESLGKPTNMNLWWIQKRLGEKPDADSILIQYY